MYIEVYSEDTENLIGISRIESAISYMIMVIKDC